MCGRGGAVARTQRYRTSALLARLAWPRQCPTARCNMPSQDDAWGDAAIRWRVGVTVLTAVLLAALPLVAAEWCASSYQQGTCGVTDSPHDYRSEHFSIGANIVDILTYTGSDGDAALNCLALWASLANYVWSDLEPRIWVLYLGGLLLFQVGICVWPLTCVGISGIWAALSGTTVAGATLSQSRAPATAWALMGFGRRMLLVVTGTVLATVYGCYFDPFSITAHTVAWGLGFLVGRKVHFPTTEEWARRKEGEAAVRLRGTSMAAEAAPRSNRTPLG